MNAHATVRPPYLRQGIFLQLGQGSVGSPTRRAFSRVEKTSTLRQIPMGTPTAKDNAPPSKSDAIASKPAVYCAHAELWPVEKLVPHPRNPNKHPEEQIRLLAKVIAANGWRSPIVISRRSGFVIKGHGRREAAILGGFDECPVDVQDYASEVEELTDLIADNRLAELADMDSAALKELLEELDTGEIDMEIAGFTEDALANLMTQIRPLDEEQTRERDENGNQTLTLIFVEDDDARAVLYAIERAKAQFAITGSKIDGRAIAEICRAWNQ